MSLALVDYRIEILRQSVGAALGSSDIVDVTDRCSAEDMTAINRAADRDLLSFKTGDVTLGFWNADGLLSDAFAFFGVTDHWQLRIFRRGAIQFWGIIVGQGSLHFDKKEKTCEITAYGLNRMLNDVSAETVKRTLTMATLTGAHLAGVTVLNVNSTSNLLPKDTVHLRNAAQSLTEDVTVKYVNSATQFTVTTATVNGYANGDLAEVTTPFYRYKTIRFLVESLFTAAGFPLADYRMSRSIFNTAGPAPISHGGLGTAQEIHSPAAERNGRAYAILDGTGSYYQPTSSPDADWVQEDATQRPWVDWSRYRKQIDGAPNIILRFPDAVGSTLDEWMCGIDDRDATTKYAYRARMSGSSIQLVRNSTTDGTTWTGWVDFAAASPVTASVDVSAIEFDQARGQVYVQQSNGGVGGSVNEVWMYDIGAASWTRVNAAALQAGGLRYIPERDYLLGSYEASGGGLTFTAYRNGAKIFERTAIGLPTYIRLGSPVAAGSGYPYMTQGARYLDGKIYLIALYDKAVCQVSSSDDFTTATIGKIIEGSIYSGGAFGSRVADAMYWFANSASGVTDRAYHVSAAFYAGVVGYADFTSQSCAEGLKQLAIITNALFWVDDDAQGHFVARDLYIPGDVSPLDGDPGLAMDRLEDPIWEESISFVEVSGAGFSAVGGNSNFAASSLNLTSDLLPNAAFTQSLADAYYKYYGRKRSFSEVNLLDPDGRIYRPLDRVSLEGIRYLVYESDHNLIEDEIAVKLLEDA